MHKIFIAVDGSGPSLAAVHHALALVRGGLRAQVVLANVQEPATLYELVTSRDPDQIAAGNEIFSPRQAEYDHAELILEAYAWHTSQAGGARGAVMLGDEMLDEASRKMALVIAGKGRAAGMRRETPPFMPPA